MCIIWLEVLIKLMSFFDRLEQKAFFRLKPNITLSVPVDFAWILFLVWNCSLEYAGTCAGFVPSTFTD